MEWKLENMEKSKANEILIKQLMKEKATIEISEAFYAVADSGFNESSPWTTESIYLSIGSENSTVFYASIDEKIVGFIVASETPFTLDIYLVVVDEEYKNRQIGRRLFQTLIQYAKEKEIPEILLETRQSNHPAIALYKRVGFEKVGVRKAYYSSPIEDAVVMKREVGEEN